MSCLELVATADGPRHRLEGRMVKPMDLLEIRVPPGQWIRGTYAWTGELGRAAEVNVLIGLWIPAGAAEGTWEAMATTAMELTPATQVRWPTPAPFRAPLEERIERNAQAINQLASAAELLVTTEDGLWRLVHLLEGRIRLLERALGIGRPIPVEVVQ